MRTDPHLSPRFANSALITVDVQRDFLSEAEHGVEGTTEILPELGELARHFRRAGRPIVHVVRLYPAGGEDADLVRRTPLSRGASIVRPGSAGAEIAPEVLPADSPGLDAEGLLGGAAQELGPDEHALFKPRWGAFFRTRLDELLRSRGVDTLVVGGCNLPNCPRATLVEGSERDYRLVLPLDAVSRYDEQAGDELGALGVSVLTAHEVSTGLTTAVG